MAVDSGDLYSGWGGNFAAWRLRYRIIRQAVDVPGNRSLVEVLVWLQSQPGNSFSGLSTSLYTSIGGAVVCNVIAPVTIGSGSEVLVMQNSRWVPHNADGTLTVEAGVSVQNGHMGYVGAVNWLTLDPIPRATTPTLSGDQWFVTGTARTIQLLYADSSFTHDVTYVFGSQSGTIATGAGVSTSFTPPHSLLTEIPNAASGPLVITVVTRNGAGTVVGSKSVSFPLVANASIVPTVDTVTWTDQNTTVATEIGAFVQGLSLVKGAVAATGIHGSTIASKRLIVAGQTVAENTPILLNTPGTVTASGEATDSRGRIGSKAANIPVLAYEPPKLGANQYLVRRANSSNVPTDNGTYVRVDLHALASSLVVGSEKNNLIIDTRTRPLDGPWTTRNHIVVGLTHNTAFQVSGGSAFPVDKSFLVEITIVDRTGTGFQILALVGPEGVAYELAVDGVSFGKRWERGALDVGGDGYFTGVVYADGIDAGDRLTKLSETRNAASLTEGTVAAARLPAATESAIGAVERATQAEVNTGTDTTRYVSPSTMRGAAYRAWAEAAGQITTSAGGAITVTLPAGRFTQAPRTKGEVISHANVCVTHIRNITTTSFSLSAYTIGGGRVAATVDWQATQMTSSNASG